MLINGKTEWRGFREIGPRGPTVRDPTVWGPICQEPMTAQVPRACYTIILQLPDINAVFKQYRAHKKSSLLCNRPTFTFLQKCSLFWSQSVINTNQFRSFDKLTNRTFQRILSATKTLRIGPYASNTLNLNSYMSCLRTTCVAIGRGGINLWFWSSHLLRGMGFLSTCRYRAPYGANSTDSATQSCIGFFTSHLLQEHPS